MAQKVKKKKNLLFLSVVILLLAAVFLLFFHFSSGSQYYYDSQVHLEETDSVLGSQTGNDEDTEGVEEDTHSVDSSEVFHMPTPDSVKAIYMTSCVVSTPSFRNDLVELVEETELNSIMIDIKDFTGTLSYKPLNPELDHMWQATRCGTSQMQKIVSDLNEKGIYVIGRVTVFQDPHLASRRPDLAVKFASSGEVWEDNKGLAFTDVSAREVWDYHIDIAKDAHQIGFDEINFDYIRFPSDGPMRDIHFPFTEDRDKAEALEEFFVYLYENLNQELGMVTSGDLFGMTTTNFDHLGVGQVLERAMPYFDYLAPMVYPSHYPTGFNDWSNPNLYPYELIYYVLSKGVDRVTSDRTRIETLAFNERIYQEENIYNEEEEVVGTEEVFTGYYKKPVYDPNKIRPFLQDFKYGGNYGPEEVRAQIEATYDVGLHSWMLWAPSNRYTQGALLTE